MNIKFDFLGVVLNLILLCLIPNLNAQTDSLKSVIQNSKKDTVLIINLNELSAKVLKEENINGSLEYSHQALLLANKLNYIKGEALALKNMGLAEYHQGNYLKVLEYWSKSLEAYKSVPDTLGIANMLNNLGAVYYSQGSNAKAIDFYLESLNISLKLKEPLRICSALLNIAGLYGEIGDYEQSIKYFRQIEPYLTNLKDVQIHSTYLMGMGEVYAKKKDYDKAIKYFKEALPLNKNGSDYAHNLKMLGETEYEKGNFSKSVEYLELAYATAKEKNQQLDMVQSLIAIGNTYQKKDFQKALNSYKEAENLALKMGVVGELKDIYGGMSHLFREKKDFANAYKYQSLFVQQKDSLFNLETDDKIRGLQFDFELDKKQDQISLLEKEAELQQNISTRQKYLVYAASVISILILLLALGTYRRYRYIQKTNSVIEDEKNRSENLLQNILPHETALELKKYGKVKAKKFEAVTVMFTDFKGFTQKSASLSPEQLVESVDYYFSKFDLVMEKFGLEKIKTIGDAYMCAGGLPFPKEDHGKNVLLAAFEILHIMKEAKEKEDDSIANFDIRIGINTGPVVAGVVGTKKFAYDIWGDTVNVAARMESSSEPMKINVSEHTYSLIKDVFDCSYRGKIDVKNKGIMSMYFVNNIKNNEVSKPV